MRFFRRPAPQLDTKSGFKWLYAIGDIHGCLGLLDKALEAIERHSDGWATLIVTLGDYVDRGPESAGVVARLKQLQEAGKAICLGGNHEGLMTKALRSGHCGHWYRSGGEATLASYKGNVPIEHIQWLENLPLTFSDAHRIFVHAGLAPFVPFEEQDEETCTWIRTAFLEAPAEAFPAHVVHGHTPYWQGKPDCGEPELLPHRTNLDTGAYETGCLAVGVFDPSVPGGPLEILRITSAGTDLEG